MVVKTDIWISRANDVYLSLILLIVVGTWFLTAPFPQHHMAVNIITSHGGIQC